MDITAHGGAFATGRNSVKFFDTIKNYPVDIIEVDVYQKRGHLYISHLPKLFPKKRALTLRYVFDYIKEHSYKVNCDVKRSGLVKPVIELAKDVGVTDKILFTGNVSKRDINELTEGAVYLNTGSLAPHKPIIGSLSNIKTYIDSLNNERIKGINISYKFCTEEFLDKVEQVGLRLSVYTVDKTNVLERLIFSKAIDNITTNIPDYALKLLGRL